MTPGDKKFISRLTKGYEMQLQVARAFLVLGFVVQTQPLYVREKFGEPGAGDDFDLLVTSHWDDYRNHIEVKSRKVDFTCVEDFPYDSVFVEAARTWHRRTPESVPDYHITVSQETGAMIALNTDAKQEYLVQEFRSGGSRYMACDLEHWIDFPELAERIAN